MNCSSLQSFLKYAYKRMPPSGAAFRNHRQSKVLEAMEAFGPVRKFILSFHINRRKKFFTPKLVNGILKANLTILKLCFI